MDGDTRLPYVISHLRGPPLLLRDFGLHDSVSDRIWLAKTTNGLGQHCNYRPWLVTHQI